MIRFKWMLLVCIAVVGFLIDWYTKDLAVKSLSYGVPTQVLGNFLQFVLVYNKGMLFGIDPVRLLPWFPLNIFFLIFSMAALGFLLFFYWRIPRQNILMHWGTALIVPGALGNFFDRIIRPAEGVVDFIQIGLSQKLHWYIFNCADIFVTVGMVILFYCLMAGEKSGTERKCTQEV